MDLPLQRKQAKVKKRTELKIRPAAKRIISLRKSRILAELCRTQPKRELSMLHNNIGQVRGPKQGAARILVGAVHRGCATGIFWIGLSERAEDR